MSRLFANPSVPFIGTPYTAPATVCKKSNVPPITVPLYIQWATYGVGTAKPNLNIGFNFEQLESIDLINSVYIDNLGNNVPVYVYFADTNYTVACQPNATCWQPVMTNGKKGQIIGQGFTDADTNTFTRVTFSNVVVPPYIDIELDQSVSLFRASPSIQRGNTLYNSKFAPAALGDQTAQTRIGLTAPSTATFLSPQANGFYVLTNLQLNLNTLQGGAAQFIQLFIESTGIAGILYTIEYGILATVIANVNVLNIQPAQIKIDATQTWRMRNPSALSNGAAQLIVNYSYIPD